MEDEDYKKRVIIFIDGSNFYHSTWKKGRKIKFKKLFREILGNRELVNAFYYVANLDITVNPKKYWDDHQKFLNILRKVPKLNVVLCTLRKIKKKDGKFDFVLKGDDIHLASDLVEGACKDKYDVALLISGDEDFVPSIKIAQREGKKVENVYFSASSSNTLRVVCDKSICLDKIIDKIT